MVPLDLSGGVALLRDLRRIHPHISVASGASGEVARSRSEVADSTSPVALPPSSAQPLPR
jgi:hypothetical protein